MAKKTNSKAEKVEEMSKFDVVKQVLSENGRITLRDAIAKAKALKTLKVKDEDHVWSYTFKNAAAFGAVKIETETFVELA